LVEAELILEMCSVHRFFFCNTVVQGGLIGYSTVQYQEQEPPFSSALVAQARGGGCASIEPSFVILGRDPSLKIKVDDTWTDFGENTNACIVKALSAISLSASKSHDDEC
jgi:hypothetical protein